MRVYTGPCDVLEPEGPVRTLPGHRTGHSLQAGIIVHDVHSFSDPRKIYKVREFSDGSFSCDCEDFTYRGAERPCKHILKLLARQGRAA